ncbi:MAG: DUF2807 domain-containing protein [Bacteroidetes bacterium]|nr:DUF2807 domain-containing protein [Bacteroidota bacterium]
MNILKLSHFLIISTFILFTSCEKECSDTISESFLASNFHTIKAGDDHRITLKEASSWSVKATGCEEDINALKVYVINGELSISYPDDYEVNELVKFTIGAPTFSTLILEEKQLAPSMVLPIAPNNIPLFYPVLPVAPTPAMLLIWM